jgi:hypothetical protein
MAGLIKSRRFRRLWNVSVKERQEMHTEASLEKLKEIVHLEDVGLDGRMLK